MRKRAVALLAICAVVVTFLCTACGTGEETGSSASGDGFGTSASATTVTGASDTSDFSQAETDPTAEDTSTGVVDGGTTTISDDMQDASTGGTTGQKRPTSTVDDASSDKTTGQSSPTGDGKPVTTDKTTGQSSPTGNGKPMTTDKTTGQSSPTDIGKPTTSDKTTGQSSPVGTNKPVTSDKTTGQSSPAGTNKPATSGKTTGQTRPTSTTKTVASATKTTASTSVAPSEKVVPAQHAMKTYIADGTITKTQFLSSVAYMENGEIKDTFIQAYIFTPTPSFMYDYVSPYGGKRLNDKEDWLSYINDHNFKPGKNMDALEEAVETVKTTLGLKDYKVQVYFSLLYPVQGVTSFGEVNGKNLDFSKEADRLEGVKWFAQEQLRVFKSKNYKNIEVVGFNWYTEEIEMDKDAALVKGVTDYIRSIGYTSMWSPYFQAQGYDKNSQLGFDIVTMQANYYPDSNIPGNGPISRLPQLTAHMKNFALSGPEMEIGSSRPASVKGFKEYLAAGVEFGWMDDPHTTWYMNGGPAQVYSLYHSRNTYVNSGYSDMYKYIKGKLKLSDIVLDF